MTDEKRPSVLAIIPARGGSKGIPRKNLTRVAGTPLVAHAIAAARAAERVGRVVVSTDDDEIAAVSRRYGAEVVRRPAEISGDLASSESALLHVLDHLRGAEGYEPDLVVFLQCTAPLTRPEDIDGCVRALLDEDADSALAVTPFHYFLWRRGEAGGAVGVNHDPRVRPMRQEREPEFLEAGAVYVMRADGFREAKHRFFGRTALHVMPAERRLEIDEPADLERAEWLLLRRRADGALPDEVRLVVFDFDGVFTDNRVVVSDDGREAVMCHRGDGYGVRLLREAGVRVVVLSTETNAVVAERCRKLGIECHQSLADKQAKLGEILADDAVDPRHVIFVGNDLNDLGAMQTAGCSVAPADAHAAARAEADIVLTRPGGHGAVRELCDLVLNRKQGESDGD